MIQRRANVYPLWLKMTLAAVMLVFLAVGMWYFYAQQKFQRQSVEANLWSIASLKAGQIAEWRSEKLADAIVLMGQRPLIETVRRYFSTLDDHEKFNIFQSLRLVREQYHFADILLVDRQKQVRLTLNQENIASHREFASVFDRAIAEHRPVWTPLHVESEYPLPHLSIVAPLFSEEDVENPVGAIVLISDATQFLYDDASILKLGTRILESLGYAVLSSDSPSEAVRLAQEHTGKIDILITDVVMPEMNGRELSEQLQSLYPNLKILFMSGYTANVIAHRGVLEDGVCFISKPFSKRDMAVKVREVLDNTNS